MKRFRIAALVCAALACAVFALAGCEAQDYTPQAKDQTVPDTALGEPGVLRVGVNVQSAPLAGQTSQDARIVGIDADVAAYMADQMGLSLQLVDVGADPATALALGTVDMVLGVDTAEAELDCWKSDVYIGKGVALFSAAADTAVPEAGASILVAAQEGSWSAKRVTDLYGEDSLSKVTDLKTALESVSSGTVRYAAGDILIGSYSASYSGLDAHAIAMLQDPSGYCAAVPTANTELQAAVAGALDTVVNGGVMPVIERKWLDIELDLAALPVVKAPVVEQPAPEPEQGDGGEGGEGAEGETAEGETAEGEAAEGEGEQY